MATEHFCLRWNNHQSTLVSVFDNLLESGTLVDCTLAADGRYLKAHKVVLSACSPYLGMLLSQHYDKHPIIILKDVKFDELKAMLDYMYRGEVNISQEQLSTFLKAAETLQIKGLTDAGSDEGNGLQPNRPPSSNSTTSANEDPQSPGPPGDGGSSPGPRKRKRNKHGDDGEGDSVSKISLSEGSDRLSGTSVGSPSAKSASVKREPADGEGDGQLTVDDSGEVVMMSRPGPSNGGTNNKAPWILSADSSGEEMQLTPGQDGRPRGLGLADQKIKKNVKDSGTVLEINEEEIKKEIKQEVEDRFEGEHLWDQESRSDTSIRNPGIIYQITRSENELIIPDPLDEPISLVDLPQSHYKPPAKSVSETYQRDDYKTDISNGEAHIFEDSNHCDYHPSVQESLSTLKQTAVEGYSKEESSRRVGECLKKVHVRVVPKSLYTKPSISQPSSVTVIDLNGSPQSLLSRPSEFCLPSSTQPSSSSVLSSKTVVDIAEAFDKKKVTVMKTKLDFHADAFDKKNHTDVFDKKKAKVKKAKLDFHTPKYRKILPAPEDNSSISINGTKSIQNVVKSTIPNVIEKQSINSLQCSVSPSNVSAGSINESTPSVQPNNTHSQQQTQSGLLNNTSPTPVLSIPQQIQVGQIRSPNPSLISIPQPLQGRQIINNTSNMLSIQQEVQASQLENSNPTLLSVAPQFSISSPIQTGNIQMQFSNNSAGNLQNTQFFRNGDGSQNQVLGNQNGVLTHQSQAVSHPVFVTSNIISSCQTSNQFLPSASVQYNFSSPTLQPNFSVPISQSNFNHSTSQPVIVPSNPASTTSTSSSEKEHSEVWRYVRMPSGFVKARFTPPISQAVNNTLLRGRGRPPKNKHILPKK